MTNIFTIWQVLLAFEISLFMSYTFIMYIVSKKDLGINEIYDHSKITLIVPMFNEEKIIREKIENTSQLDYPLDKLEIIILDDHSKDNSKYIAETAINEISMSARVIENQGGKGKARALNWLFPTLTSDITVISDADALLKADSLLQLTRNFADNNVGGVTGKIVIISDKSRLSKSQEDSYRFFYDIWRRGESKIHSVSVCNGPLMGFRTELLRKIQIDPDAYADDSDILFKVIRSGSRVVYEPKAIVFERVPLSTKGRIIQNMKRMNGLRKVYLNNLDMLGKGNFGKVIYPYALATHIISPVLILLIVLIYPLITMQQPIYLIMLLFLFIPKMGDILSSFIVTQLIMNFSFIIPTAGSWDAIQEARYNLNQHRKE